MSIRLAQPDDAEAIARVHVEAWQHAYRGTLPDAYLAGLSVEARRAMWTEVIANGPTSVLVAAENEGLAGFSSIGPCRDEDAAPGDQEIWAIYVAPAHWQRGFGRDLWLATRALAAERGARRLSLWVFASNARARRFYEKAGMSAEAGCVQTFELGGVTLEEVRYVLHLGDADRAHLR